MFHLHKPFLRTGKRLAQRGYVTSNSSETSTAVELERQSRIQEMKQALKMDGRYQITLAEFLQLAREKAHLEESDARQLLTHFHESSTLLYFPHHKHQGLQETDAPVYLKPSETISQFWDQMDKKWWTSKLHEEMGEVTRLNGQLLPLREQKKNLDTLAQNSLNRWVYGTLGYLTAQTGLLAKMTWVDYGWDVVEPMTYFITFSTAIGAFVYFAMFRNEYTYEDAMGRIVRRSQAKQYRKHNFDLRAFQQLEEKYELARLHLQQRAVDIFGLGRIPLEIQHAIYPDLVPGQSEQSEQEEKRE